MEPDDQIVFCYPTLEDGIEIFKLIKNSPPLDLNSLYYYLIFSSHFRRTSITARVKSKIAGFISAYIHPEKPDTFFIWQVAVDKAARGKKIGKRMLLELVKRETCQKVSYLETTVTPSNQASKAMFLSFAKEMNADVDESVFFSKELFGSLGHEKENLLRIGPFN